jgi:hypothetical protein
MTHEPEEEQDTDEQESDEVQSFNCMLEQFLKPRPLDSMTDDELLEWSDQHDDYM